MKSKIAQFIDNNTLNKRYPPNLSNNRPIKVTKIQHAKRLLSRLINELQTGQRSGKEAKDLCYLVISFVNLVKDEELSKRIDLLESRLHEK